MLEDRKMNAEPERLKAIQDTCQIILFDDELLKRGTVNTVKDVCLRQSSFLVAFSEELIQIELQTKRGEWYYDLNEEVFMFAEKMVKVRPLPCGNFRFIIKAYKNCTPFIGIYQPFAEDTPNHLGYTGTVKKEYNKMLRKTKNMVDKDNKLILDELGK